MWLWFFLDGIDNEQTKRKWRLKSSKLLLPWCRVVNQPHNIWYHNHLSVFLDPCTTTSSSRYCVVWCSTTVHWWRCRWRGSSAGPSFLHSAVVGLSRAPTVLTLTIELQTPAELEQWPASRHNTNTGQNLHHCPGRHHQETPFFNQEGWQKRGVIVMPERN